MCINVLEHAVQNFAALFLVFFFGVILKTSGVTPCFAIFKLRLNLLSYSASRSSTIIADKLMKFVGHLAMMVLIMGCGKYFISEQWLY